MCARACFTFHIRDIYMYMWKTTSYLGYIYVPRNYRLNRNRNSTNFFSNVCYGKQIQELFASTLDGIAASVRCVSSIIVILNVKLPD